MSKGIVFISFFQGEFHCNIKLWKIIISQNLIKYTVFTTKWYTYYLSLRDALVNLNGGNTKHSLAPCAVFSICFINLICPFLIFSRS